MNLADLEREFGDIISAPQEDEVNDEVDDEVDEADDEVDEVVVDEVDDEVSSDEQMIKLIGSKREVWNGSAERTSGNLTKSDLMKNKRGRIVSKKKHALGLKAFKQNKLKPNMNLSNKRT